MTRVAHTFGVLGAIVAGGIALARIAGGDPAMLYPDPCWPSPGVLMIAGIAAAGYGVMASIVLMTSCVDARIMDEGQSAGDEPEFDPEFEGDL